MKGKAIGLFVALLALGVAFGIALACPPPPPEQPQCPPGTIEVTPAQFVAEVTQLQHRHRVFFMWGSWSAGACHGYGTCQERTVVIAEAYWVDPVCYVSCSETTSVFGEWSAWHLDGSLLKRERTISYFDVQDPGLSCGTGVDVEAENAPVAATPLLDVACREGKNWAFVTPVFGDGIVSIEIVGVATYFPPTGQAVQLAENTYEFVAVLADGYVGEGLAGTFDVPLCPVRYILPKTAW